jgi:uncharacterized protein (TIRG00374 family)
MSPAIPPVTSVSPQHADPKAADSAARETGARHRWHWPLALLRHGAAIALLAAVLRYFLIPEIRQAHLSQLAHISVPWLIAGTLLEGISLFCYSLLTRCLLPAAGPRLLTVFRIDMSCTALGHVVPAGSAASAALGYRLFSSRGVKPGEVCFMMASQGPGSSVVLNLLLWAAVLASIPLSGFHRIYLAAGLAGLAALLTAAGLLYVFTKGEERVIRLARRAIAWIPRVREDAAERLMRALAGSVRSFRADPRRMRRSLCWAAANWLLEAASLWCFVASFGHYADPVLLFAAFGIANVAAALPLTPSGLGVIEVTLPLLLAGNGVTKGVATLAVIGWRLVSFWLPIPSGAAAYLSLRLPRSSWIGAGRRVWRRPRPAMAGRDQPAQSKPAPVPRAAETDGASDG